MKQTEELVTPVNHTALIEEIKPCDDRVDRIDTVNHTALIEEYKSCDDRVGRIDTVIWTMATVVFPISLAGLSYFGINAQHTFEQFLIIIAVGSGSVSLLLTWYFLSRQWHSYQQLAFYRMREIEAELGFWQYRYASFAKRSVTERDSLLQGMDETQRDRFQMLHEFVGWFPHFGFRRAMKVITVIFVLGWIALILRETVLLFF